MADNQPLTGDILEEIAWALKPAADTGDDCVVNARAVYDAIRAAQTEINELKIAKALVTEGGMSPQDAGKVAPSLARAGVTAVRCDQCGALPGECTDDRGNVIGSCYKPTQPPQWMP